MNRVGTSQPTAFLVAAELRNARSAWSLEDSLDELAELARTAGLTVLGRTTQRLRSIHPGFYIGEGKVAELRAKKEQLGYDFAVFDDELSPRQLGNLEDELDTSVLDRTSLILDIFAQHARTREGAVQVELAQYEYRLSRLTRGWTHLSRQAAGRQGVGGQGAGGVGLRGPGETQLETDRREIQRRVTHLKAELKRVRTHRTLQRQNRGRHGVPVVAIVGYTNAGKSTLLNSLSDSSVLAEDKLFATLDPTTRRVSLPSGRQVLMTDTVGFIQKLPTQLVAAFRATLEGLEEADLLVHVVDVTHPSARQQTAAVADVLRDLNVAGKPTIVALNKIDKLPDKIALDDVHTTYPDHFAISARRRLGLDQLLERVSEILDRNMVDVTVVIPYNEGRLLHQVHEVGVIEQEEHREQGTYLRAKLPVEIADEYRSFLSP